MEQVDVLNRRSASTSESGSFTHHDESFIGSRVFGGGLPLAWLHAHQGDIGVGVNGEEVTGCLLLGKLTPLVINCCSGIRTSSYVVAVPCGDGDGREQQDRQPISRFAAP